MISPVGSNQHLTRITLSQDLQAYQCPETGGIYLPAQSYWRWLQNQPDRLQHLPLAGAPPVPSSDDTTPKLCPECGVLMTSYRVGHGFNFRIDRSPTGGIWLDAGEWNQLKARNFHDELHLVFTAPWQRVSRQQQQAAALEQTYRSKLGDPLFDRVSALASELADHPHRQAAIALLCQH